MKGFLAKGLLLSTLSLIAFNNGMAIDCHTKVRRHGDEDHSMSTQVMPNNATPSSKDNVPVEDNGDFVLNSAGMMKCPNYEVADKSSIMNEKTYAESINKKAAYSSPNTMGHGESGSHQEAKSPEAPKSSGGGLLGGLPVVGGLLQSLGLDSILGGVI